MRETHWEWPGILSKMEGQGDSAPSIESFGYRQKEESPSQKPSKPKYHRREERGGKECIVCLSQADGSEWPRQT